MTVRMTTNVVVMIHGTFARGADWTKEDSSLAAMCRRAFVQPAISTFEWSGANNHRARVQAGRELADHVAALRRQWSGCYVHLIAHSHGGNVALYALSRLPARSVASLTCLGTPFLLLSRTRDLKSLAENAAMLFAAVCAAGGFMMPAMVADLFVPSGDGWLQNIMLIGLLLLGFYLAVKTYRAVQPRTEIYLFERLRREQADAVVLAPKQPDCPMFVASVARDEAGILLGTLDRLSNTPRAAMDVALNIVAALAAGGLMSAVTIVPVSYLLIPFLDTRTTGRIIDAALVPFFLALLLTLAVMLAVGVLTPFALSFYSLVRTSPIAFGGENPFFAAAIRIVPSAMPMWKLPERSMRQVYIADSVAFGGRHSSLYADARLFADLERWLAGLMHPSAVLTAKPANRLAKRSGNYLLPGALALWLGNLALSAFYFWNESAFRAILGPLMFFE